jgi:hypothetical protein
MHCQRPATICTCGGVAQVTSAARFCSGVDALHACTLGPFWAKSWERVSLQAVRLVYSLIAAYSHLQGPFSSFGPLT